MCDSKKRIKMYNNYGVSFIGFKVRKNKRIFGALTWMIRML